MPTGHPERRDPVPGECNMVPCTKRSGPVRVRAASRGLAGGAVLALLLILASIPSVSAGSADASSAIEARFAVAKRQGICKAMAYHLRQLKTADETRERDASLSAITRLGADLLNAYADAALMTSSSEARAVIWKQWSSFRDARQELLVTVRRVQAKRTDRPAEAVRDTCRRCHAAFRDVSGGEAL